MSTININGRKFEGNNITIKNNKVYVDGKDMTPEEKQISIVVEGDVLDINADNCEVITIHGEVRSIKTMSGDVKCGNVNGSVSTMSGDVTCGNIAGGVKTMSGDIFNR